MREFWSGFRSVVAGAGPKDTFGMFRRLGL
jgi:hypothetical protein